MTASRAGMNIAGLDPVEVENIRKNTFIMADKQLTPTHNLQRIQGKTFKAVDVEEKVFEPITPEQFSCMVHTGQREQVVY